ncbi:MAG: hypothetical protein J6S89_03710 [Paludibacteraceae bacterium]|nr:hypothetical protein [Paludibacteraceae bacterium]
MPLQGVFSYNIPFSQDGVLSYVMVVPLERGGIIMCGWDTSDVCYTFALLSA